MTHRQAELAAWIIGVVGIIGTAVGSAVAPDQFPHAWLAALAAWLGWPLGCMGLILIHALTGGRWGYAIRPQLAAGMGTLWLLLPAVVPLLAVLRALYPWLHADIAAHLDNRYYLNLPFFLGRGLIYLIVWFGLNWLILRGLNSDHPDAALARIAPAGLILLPLTVTYAVIDTTMSLDPRFASSDYGLVAISQMGLLALAVSLFAAAIAAPPDRDTLQSLGNLLMGLLILWAYLDFVQLLIIWNSDLPYDATWYIVRWSGGWGIAAAIVAICHFVLPFFALLSPSLQRTRTGLACVTGVLIAGAIVRGWWLVVPAAGRPLGALDVLAMLGLLGVAVGLAFRVPLPASVHQVVRGHG